MNTEKIGTKPKDPGLVLIPGGKYFKGLWKERMNPKDPIEYEEAFLGDYYISKYPVTNSQYKAFLIAAGREYPSKLTPKEPILPDSAENKEKRIASMREYLETKPDNVVLFVSEKDALAYCGWLSSVLGRKFRLPASAEWEKAARGGIFLDGDDKKAVRNPYPKREYPWGLEPPSEELADMDYWGVDGYLINGERKIKTLIRGWKPVGYYEDSCSPYGIYNMGITCDEICGDKARRPYRNEEHNVLKGGRNVFLFEQDRKISVSSCTALEENLFMPHTTFRLASGQ